MYLDDILVFFNNENKHKAYVKEVLKQLLEVRLFCKLEKCEFGM